MLSPLLRRLSAVRPRLPNPRLRLSRQGITTTRALGSNSASTQTKTQQEAAQQARHLAEAKRRALLREDFSLPLRLLKGLVLLLTVSGGTLALHTAAVHAFAEHTSPTPAALDFWTRTHLRRAFMLQEYQHDPRAALRYLQRAVEEENKHAEEKQWAVWKREYLQLVMRLAHAYLLALRVEDATRVVAGVSEELHAKLVSETTTTTSPGADSQQVGRLAKLLVQVDAKLAGLYVRLGQTDVARDVAWDAVELAKTLAASGDRAAVVAGAWMAWADANKAAYLATKDENARENAERAYQEVMVITTAARSVGDPEGGEGKVTFIEEGMPQRIPLACLAAIASFHTGDLLATQRYTEHVPSAPSPSTPWWPFASGAATPPVPPAPDTSDILSWFQTALTLASTAGAARACQECQSATLATAGQVFAREGDQVQAVHFYREALKVAKNVGDVESERVSMRGLNALGVPLEDVEDDQGNAQE